MQRSLSTEGSDGVYRTNRNIQHKSYHKSPLDRLRVVADLKILARKKRSDAMQGWFINIISWYVDRIHQQERCYLK